MKEQKKQFLLLHFWITTENDIEKNLKGVKAQVRLCFCIFFYGNKQYITLDNSYALLYTVYQIGGHYEYYYQSHINGTYL